MAVKTWIFSILIFFSFAPKLDSKTIIGNAKVIDGDTIHIGKNKIRLHGIDAPEIDQTCTIKDKVWNRDGGKCVKCGSNEDLEFDHIIPHSKGGANTYRNIQLLCEPCNRKKSAKIG